MNILLWLVLGVVAGWIASVIMGTREQGILMDVTMGVLGAIVGGLVMNFFGQAGITGFDIRSLLVATVGAVALIWVGRMLSSPKQA